MNAFFSRCRSAWRGSFAGSFAEAIPVPMGVCLAGVQRRDAFALHTGLAALLLLPVALGESALAGFILLLAALLGATGLLETGFALARSRRVGSDWFLAPWLFALLLPSDADVAHATLALALGLLIGRLVLGGPGKQILSPVLLAAVFLEGAWPGAFEPMPDAAAVSGVSGEWAAALSLTAAVILSLTGAISWRTVLGGVLGLVLMSWVFSLTMTQDPSLVMSGYRHATMGVFAFVLVFLAADPGSAPLTPQGRWFLGLAAGALTVMIRVLDPGHPDGVFPAFLLAALLAPLADEWSIHRAIRRRRRNEGAWP